MSDILNHHATNLGNAAAVAAQPLIWSGYMPTILSMVASVFTIVWMGLQITDAFQKYLDRKATMRGPQGPQGAQGEPGPPGPPTASVVVVPVPVPPKAPEE